MLMEFSEHYLEGANYHVFLKIFFGRGPRFFGLFFGDIPKLVDFKEYLREVSGLINFKEYFFVRPQYSNIVFSESIQGNWNLKNIFLEMLYG